MIIDLSKHKNILLILTFALLSYLIWTYVIQLEKEYLGSYEKYVHAIHYFTALAIFSSLIWLFDWFFWRLPFLRLIRLVEQPIISGSYTGEYESSFGKGKKGKVSMNIRQTYSSTSVFIETEDSTSVNFCSNFYFDKFINATCLQYNYENLPKQSAPKGMKAHKGTAKLYMVSENQVVIEYFSDWNRQHSGKIILDKIKN